MIAKNAKLKSGSSGKLKVAVKLNGKTVEMIAYDQERNR